MTQKMIRLSADKMKNREHLGIPIIKRSFSVFQELQQVTSLSGYVFHDNGRKLYDRKVQRALKQALNTARIEDFHFHDLRHTFASYLRQQGVDIHTISILLGHRNTRTSQRYAHLSVENLKVPCRYLTKRMVTFRLRMNVNQRERMLQPLNIQRKSWWSQRESNPCFSLESVICTKNTKWPLATVWA